jgi:CubicO group peptidase (beta-lactamase class C family)
VFKKPSIQVNAVPPLHNIPVRQRARALLGSISFFKITLSLNGNANRGNNLLMPFSGFDVPLKPAMVFNIGSITKQFTAVAILQLVEQGKISLQDSVQKFIPDFPSKGYAISIEHLLTHTSGIRDFTDMKYPGIYMERWDMSPKQMIDGFKNDALAFEPGTQFSYSNSGYYLLGYIIEKVSGERYQSYIEHNILKPLNLSHTYFDSSGILIPNMVNGYEKEDTAFKNAPY